MIKKMIENFVISVRKIHRYIKNELLVQAVKYSMVGGVCTILDFSILFILTDFFGVNYIISSIISFMIATILNYILCVTWIFELRVVKKIYQEFIFYLVISGIGLMVNTLFIWSFTEFLGFYFMISKLFATGVVFVWNFGARRYFLHTAVD